MKRILIVAFVVLAATACTPEQITAWRALQHDSVPTIGARDRDAALTLPATGHTEVVWGETVNVVAWFTDTGEELSTFVFERADGTRGLVYRNDLPAHAYTYVVTANPCWFDPFGIVTYDPAVCGQIPVSTPLPS
jgi:hypothetical protein